jgi:hypothetical protein
LADSIKAEKLVVANPDTPAISPEVFSGDADPSVSGKSAPLGSLYLRSTGESFTKMGGTDTDWDEVVVGGTPEAFGNLFEWNHTNATQFTLTSSDVWTAVYVQGTQDTPEHILVTAPVSWTTSTEMFLTTTLDIGEPDYTVLMTHEFSTIADIAITQNVGSICRFLDDTSYLLTKWTQPEASAALASAPYGASAPLNFGRQAVEIIPAEDRDPGTDPLLVQLWTEVQGRLCGFGWGRPATFYKFDTRNSPAPPNYPTLLTSEKVGMYFALQSSGSGGSETFKIFDFVAKQHRSTTGHPYA